MLILGLNFGSHDAAASLVDGSGKILFAAEEERFDRVKHSSSFPINAIQAGLEYCGAATDDIDVVSIFVDPKLHLMLGYNSIVHGSLASFRFLPHAYKLFEKRNSHGLQVADRLNIKSGQKIVNVRHHMAHAASAFYTSPFESAAVMTLDGRGEHETGAVFIGSGSKLQLIASLPYPHSIGYLYSMVTKYLGFNPQGDEYKVMGLASYGSDRLVRDFDELARLRNGFPRLSLDYFDHHIRYGKQRCFYSELFISKFGQPRLPQEEVTQHHADIAYGLQKLCEKLIIGLATKVKELTGLSRICLAGGVALNCVANQVLISTGLFERIYIQPAADDSGTSLGSALYVANSYGSARTPESFNPYLGPDYTELEIKKAVESFSGSVEVTGNADPGHVARLIYDGSVVGWFKGRMEFGPRALGNRSILASPLLSHMKDLINKKVKFREQFRPFAPVCQIESAQHYFSLDSIGMEVYPYMLSTAKVLCDFLPATTHVDGTARVQTVERKQNPQLWDLLEAFKRVSGHPVLLNTSLNVRGEPIVCTPYDSIKSFLDSEIDYLVLGDYLIRKGVSHE